MEIKQNYFAEKSLFREKRVLFVEKTTAALLTSEFISAWGQRGKAKHEAKTAQIKAKVEGKTEQYKANQEVKKEGKKTLNEAEGQAKILKAQGKTRKEMANLGIILDKDLNPVESLTSQLSAANQVAAAPSLIEGPTTKISVLKNISLKKRRGQEILADRINNLLAGKGVKKPDKKELLQETGEKILREIDPSYVRAQSGNFSLETQKVVAKVVESNLQKDVIEKALKGDQNAEEMIARKIEQTYRVLEHARERTHQKEIRKGTRNLLGPILRGSENRDHHKGLDHLKKNRKFQKKIDQAFEIEETKEQKEAAKVATAEAKKEEDSAWKPESKLGKAAYYWTIAPWLAHRLVLRPTGIAIDKAIHGSKASGNFLWEKTFKKGPLVGTARTALWIGGSALTAGVPIIPAAVEGAILLGKKMKLGEKSKKVGGEAAYAGKNVANIGTLGIPRYAAGIIKNKIWPFIRLKRKGEAEKK